LFFDVAETELIGHGGQSLVAGPETGVSRQCRGGEKVNVDPAGAAPGQRMAIDDDHRAAGRCEAFASDLRRNGVVAAGSLPPSCAGWCAASSRSSSRVTVVRMAEFLVEGVQTASNAASFDALNSACSELVA
jgi:hypothetical protein